MIAEALSMDYLACCVCFIAARAYVEKHIITHIVTLNLVWAAEQVIELFLLALCRTLFMFSLSWNVNWVPLCAGTLANPAASILPSKRSNFKSAHGAQCRIRILQHLADARGIVSVRSIVTYLQRNCAPPRPKKKRNPAASLSFRVNEDQCSLKKNRAFNRSPLFPQAPSSLSDNLVFSVTEDVFKSPACV